MKWLKQLLKSKYHIYIFPLFTIGLIIVVSIYILIPNIQNIMDNQKLILVKQEDLQKLNKKRQLLESVQSGNINQYLTDASVALPNEKDAAAQLIAFGNLANSTQVVIEQISLTPGLISSSSGSAKNEAANSLSKSLKIKNSLSSSIQIRSNNAQYLDFLKQIYNSRLLFTVDTMDINYLTEVPDMLTARLLLNTYYLPPPLQIGSVESELPQITSQEQQTLQSLAGFTDISHLGTGTDLPQVNMGKTDLFSTKK